MSSPYSNFGYIALKKQSNDNPVKPDLYQRVVSSAIEAAFNYQPINEIAGDRERNISAIEGIVEMGGSLEFMVEENRVGDWLTTVAGAPTTLQPSTGIYRHVWDVTNEGAQYTVDTKIADNPWVFRYWGLRSVNLTFNKNDNAIAASVDVMPLKCFQVSRVLTGANSGTALNLDQSEGLTTSDTILILDKADGKTVLGELTVASIVDAENITTSTIDFTIEEGDYVAIKAAADADVDYNQCQPFQFSNGTAVYEGATIDALTEVTKEDFEISFSNEIESRIGSGLTKASRYPYANLTKGYEATGSMTRFYDANLNLARSQYNDDVALRFLFRGAKPILGAGNLAVKASTTFGGANGFKIEASTAGKAGNDIAVVIDINSTDDLAASKSGNVITILLANTTASKNTGTLIAAAVDALSGVDGTAEGTGAEEFTTAGTKSVNLGWNADGTTVYGLDANQKPYLQVDFAATKFGPFNPEMDEDSVVPEEIEFTAFKDTCCNCNDKKLWSTRITLVNGIASY